MSGLEWQAVLQEIHNGTLVVYIQRGEDWENGRQFVCFTELEQQEHPERIEESMAEARQEAARLNAEEQRAEFDRLLRRP